MSSLAIHFFWIFDTNFSRSNSFDFLVVYPAGALARLAWALGGDFLGLCLVGPEEVLGAGLGVGFFLRIFFFIGGIGRFLEGEDWDEGGGVDFSGQL